MSSSSEHKIKPHPFLPPEAQGIEPSGNPVEDRPTVAQPERKFALRHRVILNTLLPVLLGLLAFKMVFLTLSQYGLSWDEAYYFDPYVKVGDWVTKMIAAAEKPVYREAIDDYFEEINELPAVPKLVYGTSYKLFSPVFGPLTSVRLVSAAAFALLVILIYLFSKQYFGPVAGLVAALLYLFTPRAFGHAHLSATETFTALVYFAVAWLFIKGLGRRIRWSVAFAILLGIAMATRVNCLILPLILFSWALLFYKNDSVNNLYAALIISPVVMLMFWPWMWHDTLTRFVEYIQFFTQHEVIKTVYLGKIYNAATGPAPWHYPFVMLGVTLPFGHLIFMMTGLGLLAVRMKQQSVAGFVLFAIGIQLMFAAWPSTPKYDGVRLFFPVLAFLAVAGGVGFAWLSGFTGILTRDIPRKRFVLVCCLLGVSLAAAGWKMFTLPSSLMYFNQLKPFVTLAIDDPRFAFEYSYWGETLNRDMIEAINSLPENTRIKTLAMHPKVPLLLQRWGVLRKDLNFESPPPYDYHLMQFRPSFFRRPEWTLFDLYAPIKSIDLDGMPVLMLYKTGPIFESEWPLYELK